VDGKYVEARLRSVSPRILFLSIDNLDTPLIHE